MTNLDERIEPVLAVLVSGVQQAAGQHEHQRVAFALEGRALFALEQPTERLRGRLTAEHCRPQLGQVQQPVGQHRVRLPALGLQQANRAR